MKYGTSRLIGANKDAFVRVTFEDGIENPRIHLEGLRGDGGGSQHSCHTCMLEAVANMLIETCEQMKGKGNAAMVHAVKFDGVAK